MCLYKSGCIYLDSLVFFRLFSLKENSGFLNYRIPFVLIRLSSLATVSSGALSHVPATWMEYC